MIEAASPELPLSLNPAQREAATRARAAQDAEMKRWYASPPMERIAALKKMFNDAGVNIHLVKLSTNTPEATEFAFRVSKALGWPYRVSVT